MISSHLYLVWFHACHSGGAGVVMGRARSGQELQLCEECGQPILSKKANQLLCRRCQRDLERRKREGASLRQSRRGARQGEADDDW